MNIREWVQEYDRENNLYLESVLDSGNVEPKEKNAFVRKVVEKLINIDNTPK